MLGTKSRRALVVLAVIEVVLPASLVGGGVGAALADNSPAAHACQQGGYRDWSPDGTTPFRNAGDCTSFAANGGTLVPVQTCPPAIQLALNTTNMESSTPAWQTVYSASTTYDIYFAADVVGPSASSITTPTVDVSAPGGTPYAAYPPSASRSVAPIACGVRFWVSMPVAGTFIDQYGLYGVWTATASIGSQSVSTSFTINP